MGAFFSAGRGTVVRVDSLAGGTAALPIRIQIDGASLGGASGDPLISTIITQAGVVANGGYQALHAFNDTAYFYVFGDRLGDLRVGGMAFARSCFGVSGIEQVLDEYQKNRLAATASTVLVNIGNRAFRCLLAGMSLELTDAENNLSQWAYRFTGLPGI